MIVEVIQYIRPSGKESKMTTNISDACEDLYGKMMNSKCCFAAEVLQTGEISLTIENKKIDEDIDGEIVDNGPKVQKALEKMLRRKKWCRKS